MSFESVLGKGQTAQHLASLTQSNRLPHAAVFQSENITLARSAAKELAAAYLCTSENMRPCGECRSCRKIHDDIHPDVITLKAVGKQSIGVGEIREMISDCYIMPNESHGKVYLIFDKMTPEAQNALLKILEEPPSGVMFVITTEQTSLLLKTVLSRTMMFKLSPTKQIDDGNEAFQAAVEIARAIPQNIELPLLGATSSLMNSREFAKQVLDYLAEFFTLALEQKYLGEDGYEDYIIGIARPLRKSNIVKLYNVANQALEMLSHNCNLTVLSTWVCANIRESKH